ncbi:hypothetical protein M9H77_32847 [Catharanthus roseus]|uniref:Uncharacterized protein n=1 Tax=Catharanthus roseus TaxID=4058 RepID=A0ACC0A426_CATRO|nr:hypothetical protein M9H77_32847 [Catharanthus roseus]
MPMEFFHEDALTRIGNMLGKTVKIDAMTMAATKGCSAGVCIELDLTKLLVSMVSLMGFAQAIEYERLHQISFDCGKYGSRFDNFLLKGSDATTSDPIATVNPFDDQAPPADQFSRNFSPWMLPSYVWRRLLGTERTPVLQILQRSSLQSIPHLKEHPPDTSHTMGVVNSTSVDDDLAEVYSSSKDELSDDACDSATEADA